MLLEKKDKDKIRLAIEHTLHNTFKSDIEIYIPYKGDDRIYFKAKHINQHIMRYQIEVVWHGHLDSDRDIIQRGEIVHECIHKLTEVVFKKVIKVLELI